MDMEIDHYETAAAECMTPRRRESRIPADLICPPPPRKKTALYCNQRKAPPPKDGFFQPPDLEAFFIVASRRSREAFA
ncbi:hypothetical protein M5689_001926 [Euphorbia peplus]|nr:hypothetical protein M5689_001926 [Euphorbia peplus]